MILEKLIVENFRQFRGRQEIVFSDLRDRNVTLVHAENGFGKTALLNSLLWAFYGYEGLTDDVAHKERIIHEASAVRGARDPERTAATVTIQFRHEGVKYTLTRSLSLAAQLVDHKKTLLTLEVLRDGQTLTEKMPQAKIQSMMPDGISQFLFFNGERIDHLAMEDSAPQVTDAIQQMLGLKLIRAAIDDLKHQNVRGKLRSDLRDCTSDEKAALLDEQTHVDEQVTQLTEKRALTHKNLAAIEDDLQKINAKLEANRAAHELQAKRESLEKQQRELIEREATVTKRLGLLVAEDGYTLFAEGLVQRGREIMTRLRAENKIPARVLNTFLHELLERGRCICKRHLDADTDERAAVEELLTIAGDQHFNNAVGSIDNAIGVIEGVLQRTRENLQDANRERLKAREELVIIGETLDDIHQKLGSKEDEEVHKLEDTRHKLQLQRDEAISELGRIDGKLQELAAERDRLRDAIQRIEDNEEAAKRAQRRLDSVEESIALLKRILAFEIEDLRPILNEEINRHFKKIIDRGYWAELSEDFVLSIRKNVSVDDGENDHVLDVAQSTGQRQVTSLVFIASLVSLARRRAEIPTILKGLTGAEYPMVMDSPFGQLSTRFREGVSRWIPDLAPQVVIFASSTQYEGAVAGVLRESKRVGKRYYLSYHGPHLQPDARQELVVEGQHLDQYFESPEEYTEIIEIDV